MTNKCKVKVLTCCCCGDCCKGRQWWNRDTGYGACWKCIPYLGKGEDEDGLKNMIGIDGVHYFSKKEDSEDND